MRGALSGSYSVISISKFRKNLGLDFTYDCGSVKYSGIAVLFNFSFEKNLHYLPTSLKMFSSEFRSAETLKFSFLKHLLLSAHNVMLR